MEKRLKSTPQGIVIEEVTSRFLRDEDLKRMGYEYLGVSKDGRILYTHQDDAGNQFYYTTEDIVNNHKDYIKNYL
jgi:hypothetical protein